MQTKAERGGNGKVEMTMEEFKKWLKQFDTNGDHRISRNELRKAIRDTTGARFSRLKARRGIQSADRNGDGFINEDEVENLVEFAEKHLGVRVVEHSATHYKI